MTDVSQLDAEPVSLTPPPGSSFSAFDLATISDGPAIVPGLWTLLYRNCVNCISGEPGLGKSWLAVAAALTVLRRGGSVIVIDYEDAPRTWVQRLHSLGADRATLMGLQYLQGQGTPTDADTQWLPRLAGVAPDTLVVIDSMAEAMAAAGLDENLAGDVTSWHQTFARPPADAGATVLVIDHVAKDASSRGRWARGSGAKLAAVSGVALSLDVAEPFSKERSGVGTLKVAKDRHGSVGPVGAVVADVRFNVGGGSLARIEIVPTTPRPHGEGLPVPLVLHRNGNGPDPEAF